MINITTYRPKAINPEEHISLRQYLGDKCSSSSFVVCPRWRFKKEDEERFILILLEDEREYKIGENFFIMQTAAADHDFLRRREGSNDYYWPQRTFTAQEIEECLGFFPEANLLKNTISLGGDSIMTLYSKK